MSAWKDSLLTVPSTYQGVVGDSVGSRQPAVVRLSRVSRHEFRLQRARGAWTRLFKRRLAARDTTRAGLILPSY